MSMEEPGKAGDGGLLELAPGVRVPAAAVEVLFSRSGGPGGQNVNKLSTRAQMRIPLAALRLSMAPDAVERLAATLGPARLTASGDVMIVCDESRSQHANRRECFDRLRVLLAEAMRPVRKRRKTKPTKASKRRRIDAKVHRGEIKRGRSRPNDAS